MSDYVCPQCGQTYDVPGACDVCGVDLVPNDSDEKEGTEEGYEEGDEEDDFGSDDEELDEDDDEDYGDEEEE